MSINIILLCIAAFIALSICITSIALTIVAVYNIKKDKDSKETLFQIQMMAASSKKMLDAPPLESLYKVLNDLIGFYISRQLITTNVVAESDQQLSLLMDNIVITISTEVERHLSNTFKQAWEVYFDSTDTTETSHLRLYIATNVRTLLVKVIETKKSSEKVPTSKKQTE